MIQIELDTQTVSHPRHSCNWIFPFLPRVLRTRPASYCLLHGEKIHMSIDLELIRARNPIADVVGEKFTLKKTGSRFIGVEHDQIERPLQARD